MYTLVEPHRFEQSIKKSLFIAYAMPVQSVKQALDFFATHAEAEATHNCWAFKLIRDYRFNDDGEPGGTAGRPILQVIEGQHLFNVAVLVIRYFGGIKLGTGGLVRAYGGTAAQCLKLANKQEIIPTTEVLCQVSFNDMAMVKSRLMVPGVHFLHEDFNAEGVQWHLELADSLLVELSILVKNLTRAKAVWQVLDKSADGET